MPVYDFGIFGKDNKPIQNVKVVEFDTNGISIVTSAVTGSDGYASLGPNIRKFNFGILLSDFIKRKGPITVLPLMKGLGHAATSATLSNDRINFPTGTIVQVTGEGGASDNFQGMGTPNDLDSIVIIYSNTTYLTIKNNLGSPSSERFITLDSQDVRLAAGEWMLVAYIGLKWREIVRGQANVSDCAIELIIDGGGSVILTGVKGDIEVPFDILVTQWTLLADQSGSIVIDIWQDTYANYPPTSADSIVGGGGTKPTISSATKAQSAPASWSTTTLVKGRTLRFNVDSATTIQRCTLSLRGLKL